MQLTGGTAIKIEGILQDRVESIVEVYAIVNMGIE